MFMLYDGHTLSSPGSKESCGQQRLNWLRLIQIFTGPISYCGVGCASGSFQNYYVPPTEGEGGHTAFGAEPVNVSTLSPEPIGGF